MIEESGRVVAIDPGVAWVETIRQSACDACSAKAGCGHSTLAKLGQSAVHMQAVCHIDVTVGDHVVIGVPEEIMVKSSMLAYLMPLLSMMVLALIADNLWGLDLLTTAAGLSGLSLGFVALRWHFHRNQHDDRYQPVVLRRLYGSPQAESLNL